jgi:hypothetical protein
MRPGQLFSLLLPLAAVACGGSKYAYNGQNLYDFFPLEDNRSWEYGQDDTSVAYRMSVTKNPVTTDEAGTEVVTLDYMSQDPEALLYSVQWSSDSSDGVLIWGWTDGATGEAHEFRPPIVFAEAQMDVDQKVKTTTNGTTYTATFKGLESCANHWVRDDWECAHIILDDGDGDPNIGDPFVGEYWTAVDWGPSSFVPTGFTQPWVLLRADWSPDEEE